ncbi:hypothetical protein GGS23DRAFT_575496 [Durotheca rogersii]|uniref:uncharacterized protein n=1 Tax=Durotheca rogersii TaxID=419775 RepID=UPI00221FB968|nr:uncharacterized protein GGS23DRAFT_575496 [Durotheca rogersii]KAI5861527.1 hypothetical protein GGS23DRAFT_575496 [Durotheca rogersii]
MEDQYKLAVIKENPIGRRLDEFRNSFSLACSEKGISDNLNLVDKLDRDVLQDLTLDLLGTLLGLRASRHLPSNRSKSLYEDILRLNIAVNSDDFDLAHIEPLFIAVLGQKPDIEIWDKVYDVVVQCTPPPRTSASSGIDAPLDFTSDVVNNPEYRKFMDHVLQEELGPIWVDLDIYGTFFGAVVGLDEAAKEVFKECSEGNEPLFHQGWGDWPGVVTEENVLAWLQRTTTHLVQVAQRHVPMMAIRQQLIGLQYNPSTGSVADRKMNAGFISGAVATTGWARDWSHILVPGKLETNAGEDGVTTWLDLARCVREIFKSQDTRRFVLGFTLCGSIMRVWNFDRAGVIGSAKFDINQDGLLFVSVILAFLSMNRESLGFDPTIISSGVKRYMEVDQGGQKKRLILDHMMSRSSSRIVSRGTTCWKAHLEGESQVVVVKESWQPMERNEGELLRLATEKGVANVARHFHNWTVQVGGLPDNVQDNVRKGLDVRKGKRVIRPPNPPSNTQTCPTPAFQVFPSTQTRLACAKRSSGQTGGFNLLGKRRRSESLTGPGGMVTMNRVHQRIIMQDYGKPIYLAESLTVLLESMAQCVGGHKALYEAGILHRDISLNNIMINNDRSDPSRLGFLIDLDLATKVLRDEISGMASRTGTRAFMSIRVLWGEPHSFMDDLESFFWVLYWICVHHANAGSFRTVHKFEKWNREPDPAEVASMKIGLIAMDQNFDRITGECCTEYYEPLIPCLCKLRRIIFPGGNVWIQENLGVYKAVQDVLREAQKGLAASS